MFRAGRSLRGSGAADLRMVTATNESIGELTSAGLAHGDRLEALANPPRRSSRRAATLLLATFYLVVVHGVMAWIARQDPIMVMPYLRSVGARDFYKAHAGVRAPFAPVRPSIPPG